MRVTGYCTGCRKIKQVSIKSLGTGTPTGRCASCAERDRQPDVELTVYVLIAGASEVIPPRAAIVGRHGGSVVDVAYEPSHGTAISMAGFEERVGRAADRLLRDVRTNRASLQREQLCSVAVYDVRRRRMVVNDRVALERWTTGATA